MDHEINVMFFRKQFLLIITLITFYIPNIYAQRNNLLWDVNLSGKSPLGLLKREVLNSDAQQISDTVKRYGLNSIRFQVKSGSFDERSIRSEIKSTPEINPERWYGLSIYPPQAFVADNEPEIVTQWHNRPDVDLGEKWLSPCISVWVKNGRWSLHVLWDTARVTVQNHWMGEKDYDLGEVRNNEWTDWVLHIKFSNTNAGLIEVFKNGKKVCSRVGPNNFNDEQLPYWKIGIYKWVYKKTNVPHKSRVLYYSQIRKGSELATYKDVAPGNY